MKGLSFRQQVAAGGLMMIFAYVLAFRANRGIIINICWGLFGLAFIINPVAPDTIRRWFQDRTPGFMRVLGGALILGGLLSTADLGLG